MSDLVAGWLDTLHQEGFVVVDTSTTHYASAESAIGVLRRKARKCDLTLYAELLGAHRAVVAVVPVEEE